MLVLNLNRKPYIGILMAPIDLTLSDLDRSISRSPIFESPVSRKGVLLSPVLLNIIMKPYMGSPMALSRLTLKGQTECHSDFEALYVVEEPS